MMTWAIYKNHVPGWVGRWLDVKSRFKDCLQQPKLSPFFHLLALLHHLNKLMVIPSLEEHGVWRSCQSWCGDRVNNCEESFQTTIWYDLTVQTNDRMFTNSFVVVIELKFTNILCKMFHVRRCRTASRSVRCLLGDLNYEAKTSLIKKHS